VLLTATALLNGLLGATLGIWFRFQVLIPPWRSLRWRFLSKPEWDQYFGLPLC
jgi:hypothetical protein